LLFVIKGVLFFVFSVYLVKEFLLLLSHLNLVFKI